MALGWNGAVIVLGTVVATWLGTQKIARLLGFRDAEGVLVAAGYAICGASAVVAMEPRTRARPGDGALAVALVTLCGSVAMVVLPLLQHPLGLDDRAFGVWVGASVHDVGQVAAAAGVVGVAAVVPAVVVKLGRVCLLAPLVAWQGRGRRDGAGQPTALAAVPWFVACFVALAALRTTGWVGPGLLDAAAGVQHALVLVGLVGLGALLEPARLRAVGWRALALGAAAWVLVAGVALALVLLLLPGPT